MSRFCAQTAVINEFSKPHILNSTDLHTLLHKAPLIKHKCRHVAYTPIWLNTIWKPNSNWGIISCTNSARNFGALCCNFMLTIDWTFSFHLPACFPEHHEFLKKSDDSCCFSRVINRTFYFIWIGKNCNTAQVLTHVLHWHWQQDNAPIFFFILCDVVP